MTVIKNRETDPYFNMASEEYMLEMCRGDVFMLWRNGRAVIIGKNQNAYAEVNIPYVQENGIKVVRRLTGGGAVFHDPGNINFTFITDAENVGALDFARFEAPIIYALSHMGVDAALDGRNDIIAAGCKISGNAQCVYNTADGRKRLMHHGTLLFSADMSSMSGALNVSGAKLRSKGVKSVRQRVVNIADIPGYSGPSGAAEFMDAIMLQLAEVEARDFSAAEKAAICELAEKKYSAWQWNYGASPGYSLEKSRRFPFGTVEVMLTSSGGIIEAVDIRGDFFGVGDISELCRSLCGVRLETGSLTAALSNVGDYISGAEADDIASLILNGGATDRYEQ